MTVGLTVSFKLNSFYRATLCVSAVFAVARCPSVCLSRWCVVPTLLERPSHFFVGLVAPSLYFFLNLNHSSGMQNTRGWSNFAIFHWNRRLSRKRYDRPMIDTRNVNKKSYALYRMVTFPLTLTDP